MSVDSHPNLFEFRVLRYGSQTTYPSLNDTSSTNSKGMNHLDFILPQCIAEQFFFIA